VLCMRLGVFLPNWVGDVIMATPTLRALSNLVGRDGSLIGIMRPYVAEVLAGNPWINEQIVYDKPPHRIAMADKAVYAKLREAKLDRIVLLPNSLRTAWLAWRSGAAERIGYVGDMRAWLLTKRLRKPRMLAGDTCRPTIDSYLELAAAASCPPEPPRMELATTKEDERAADAVWRRLGLPDGERVVVLNPGGAYGAAKHWPAEHFAALARRIVADSDFYTLVNCGPAERPIAREIVLRAADPRVVSLAETHHLPIGLTKACIRRSRLLVTTDSGPRFIGIAFERPVVTLFGPTDPRMTETHYEAETCLSLGLECQPCMARECPLGHQACLRDLSVQQVYAAVVRHLEPSSPNAAEGHRRLATAGQARHGEFQATSSGPH
jgi:heptosyltransferase-2